MSIYLCAHWHVSHKAGMEVKGPCTGVHSLLLLCRFQGLNSGHQAWQQALYLLMHHTDPVHTAFEVGSGYVAQLASSSLPSHLSPGLGSHL